MGCANNDVAFYSLQGTAPELRPGMPDTLFFGRNLAAMDRKRRDGACKTKE